MGPKLNEKQIAEIQKELVKNGVPVRFIHEGCSLSIVSGVKAPQGVNVIHQVVYWHFSRDTALKIAKWLGVRAVFSE